jgi:hypothetical protein
MRLFAGALGWRFRQWEQTGMSVDAPEISFMLRAEFRFWNLNSPIK